jgi:uncharacterized RDD family membrane protein YckC
MPWHYVRDNTTQAPVELTELQRLRQQGAIQADTPVWTDGMPEWTPYEKSTAAGSPVMVTSGGITVATRPCVECGKSFPESEMLNYEGKWVCAADKPLFFQRIKEGVVAPGTLQYASVGRRFVAIFIDAILIDMIVLLPLMLIYGFSFFQPGGRSEIPTALNVVIYILEYLIPALYEILLIGKYGATLGKMAMKIKVVRPDGGAVSYGQSVGRYFAKILSGIIFAIGYIMAFWDPEKRALHDRICATRVVSADV